MELVPADTLALWGQMNAPQMLAHLNSALMMGLGELKTVLKRSPLASPPGAAAGDLRAQVAAGHAYRARAARRACGGIGTRRSRASATSSTAQAPARPPARSRATPPSAR